MASARSQALSLLAKEQQADGSFIGLASRQPDEFNAAVRHPTTFFTALILNCLQDVRGSAAVRKRAADWLWAQRGSDYSWNYWRRDSQEFTARPYPDDLDDTACALAALTRQRRGGLPAKLLAALARQLIATEAAPGGPYRTWLVEEEAAPVWRDVDPAVNANIGWLLSLHDVRLPGLDTYLEEQLGQGELASPYYCGSVPLLYFLSRWYDGPALPVLRQQVTTALASSEQRNSLMTALLLTAGVNLGLNRQLLLSIQQQLESEQRPDGSWPAAALYFEPPEQGRWRYAGSEALTTAFCLEALAAASRRPATTAAAPAPAVIPVMIRADLGPSPLGKLYRQVAERQIRADRDGQITAIATKVAAAAGQVLSPTALTHLNSGSLHGWLAYTIYDDFWDQEGDSTLVGVANLCLRQSLTCFRAALPEHPVFERLAEAAMDRMDGANTWEVTAARAPVEQGRLKLPDILPDYRDYQQLADRSWGHSLAGTGVLLAAGYVDDGPEVSRFQDFFQHFLIARQLNDDAHDWEDDLTKGHLTAVVTQLLHLRQSADPVNLGRELDGLRVSFWDQVIEPVSEQILEHCRLARESLIRCQAAPEPAVLLSWLDPLEQSARLAVSQRKEAERFIKAYRAS